MKFLKTLPFLALFIMGTNLMAGKHTAPDAVAGTTNVTHVEAKELHDAGVLFLDVRGEAAYNEGHVAGSEHLDVKGDGFTQEAFNALVGAPDAKVVIYCNGENCTRSAHAAEKAVAWGFTKVYYFRGGFPDWNNNEYPAE